jgi:hypothetical protein
VEDFDEYQEDHVQEMPKNEHDAEDMYRKS